MGLIEKLVDNVFTKLLTDEKHSEFRQAVWKGIKEGVRSGLSNSTYGTNKLADKEESK